MIVNTLIKWLKRLDEYRKIFNLHLNEARLQAGNQRQKELLNCIEAEYINYITAILGC